MKAGDVSRVRTSSQETWLSAPLSDPNAALWASITPPANPTLTMMIRRRATAFSLDMLAHRLHRRFPETFSSRSTARFGILSAAVAFGAAVTALGYFAATSSSLTTTSQATHAPATVASAAPHSAASTRFVRQGETALDRGAPNRDPALAATAAPTVTEQVIQRLTPQAALADTETNAQTAQAKRAATKQSKSTARRATKPRRARVTND